MHVGFEVDEEVWLTPDDVAQGHDTVVERAIEWIQNLGERRYDVSVPEQYALHQNYPNPFNPVTILRYDIPEQSEVTITIYDLLGRQVRTLVRDVEEPGFMFVVWDGTNAVGETAGAGVYLYRIQAGDFTRTKKMVLLR